MSERPDFEEIVHTGGTVTALVEDGLVSLQIKGKSNHPSALTPVCVSLEDGKIVGFPRARGIGQGSDCPGYARELMLMSDREGLFGQKCPSSACGSYFRSSTTHTRTCPYCAHRAPAPAFLLPAQLQFLTNMLNLLISAHNDEQTKEVNLSALITDSDANRQGWVYTQTRQQTMHTCSKCRSRYDILGEYAQCPTCGFPNFRSIFMAKMDEHEAEFKQAEVDLTDRHEREVEWGKLSGCVSEFDALANKVIHLLAMLPAVPKRKAVVKSLSGQNIKGMQEKLQQWFDIDLFKGLGDDDKTFLNKMFNRRHVFTHKGGQIDQEYLNNTGDTTVRLNEKIRFSSNEIRRLIPLIRICGTHLLDGLESIG